VRTTATQLDLDSIDEGHPGRSNTARAAAANIPDGRASRPSDTEEAPMSDITLEQAQAVVQAALAESASRGLAMNVAVVDVGGNLKAFARMDGAWLGSIDISIRKARTARYFDMPTGALGELSQPGGPLFNIEVSNGGLITFPGGLPLSVDGQVIGAVGVSGSTVEDDHAVATAAAAAIQDADAV
jgi:uncharacterized protein GlcG (DUF336 family)